MNGRKVEKKQIIDAGKTRMTQRRIARLRTFNKQNLLDLREGKFLTGKRLNQTDQQDDQNNDSTQITEEPDLIIIHNAPGMLIKIIEQGIRGSGAGGLYVI